MRQLFALQIVVHFTTEEGTGKPSPLLLFNRFA